MGIEVFLQAVRVSRVISSSVIILLCRNCGRIHRKSKNMEWNNEEKGAKKEKWKKNVFNLEETNQKDNFFVALIM